ncbi:MAG: DMT family transporter [Actinobacteria bacterium]|nr:DMT family transporter [Actinomycetota bacterium]
MAARDPQAGGDGAPARTAMSGLAKSQRQGELAIVAAAVLFGSTFVVVKDAVAAAEPVPFLSVRFLIAAAVLWPVARRRPADPGVVTASFWCAIALAAGYVFQTVGLQYTSSSVSAFVTYLFVVIVPVMSALFLKRFPSPTTIAGLVVATIGLVLLSGGAGSFGKGEWLTLACAFSFAAHVVLLGHYAPRHDTWKLTCTQMAIVGVLLFGPGLLSGGMNFPAAVWAAAAYTAVAASAAAMALQIWGQRLIGPSRTSLLLMIEPVSAAFLGYLVGDRLGAKGVVGALLILAGIALAEVLPLRRRRQGAQPVPALD